MKVLFIKKVFNVVFGSSKNEEIICLPHEFIFVFIRYFIGAILMEKSCQNWGVREKYKTGDGHIGVVIEGGFRPSAHFDIERLKGGTLES